MLKLALVAQDMLDRLPEGVIGFTNSDTFTNARGITTPAFLVTGARHAEEGDGVLLHCELNLTALCHSGVLPESQLYVPGPNEIMADGRQKESRRISVNLLLGEEHGDLYLQALQFADDLEEVDGLEFAGRTARISVSYASLGPGRYDMTWNVEGEEALFIPLEDPEWRQVRDGSMQLVFDLAESEEASLDFLGGNLEKFELASRPVCRPSGNLNLFGARQTRQGKPTKPGAKPPTRGAKALAESEVY